MTLELKWKDTEKGLNAKRNCRRHQENEIGEDESLRRIEKSGKDGGCERERKGGDGGKQIKDHIEEGKAEWRKESGAKKEGGKARKDGTKDERKKESSGKEEYKE